MLLPVESTVSYRKADVDDLDALLLLIEEYYAFDSIAFEQPAIRRGLQTLLSNASYGGAWLIRDEHQSVGYILLTFGFDLEFGGRQATITELYLRPGSRKQGIGTRTLLFIEGLLRDEGVDAFELQVERDNLAARSFYEKFGMQSHDRIPMSKRISSR